MITFLEGDATRSQLHLSQVGTLSYEFWVLTVNQKSNYSGRFPSMSEENLQVGSQTSYKSRLNQACQSAKRSMVYYWFPCCTTMLCEIFAKRLVFSNPRSAFLTSRSAAKIDINIIYLNNTWHKNQYFERKIIRSAATLQSHSAFYSIVV